VKTLHRPLALGQEVRRVEEVDAAVCPDHLRRRQLVGVPARGHSHLVGARHTEVLQGDAQGPVEGVPEYTFPLV